MTDHDFQNSILEALSGIESRLEKRLGSMEAQRKEDNERLEKRLGSMEAQRKEDNERLEKRLEFMETHTSQLRQDVGWIKGKLEGKQESSSRILVVFSTGAAIAAVIIALIALFN